MAKFKRFEASNRKKDKFKSTQRDETFRKVSKVNTKHKMKSVDDESEFSTQYYQSRV